MKLYNETERMARQAGFVLGRRPVLIKRSVATHSEEETPADGVTIGEDVSCTLTGTAPLEDYDSVESVGISEAVTAELQLAGRAVDTIRALESVKAYLPALSNDGSAEGVGITESVTATLATPVEEVSESEGVTIGEDVVAELDRYIWSEVSEGVAVGESVLTYQNISLLTRNPQFTQAILTSEGWMPRFWENSKLMAGSTLSYFPDSGAAGSCYVQTFADNTRAGDYWYQSQAVNQAPFLQDNTGYTLTLVSKCTSVTGTPYVTVTVIDQEGYYLTSAGAWSTTPQAAITRSPLLNDANPVTTTLNFTSRASIANAGQGQIRVGIGGAGPTWAITAKAYKIEIS